MLPTPKHASPEASSSYRGLPPSTPAVSMSHHHHHRRRSRPSSSNPAGDDAQAARRNPTPARPLKTTDADFKPLLVLGRGAYAKVVLVEEKRTGIRYAMKILNKHHVVHKRQAEHTMTERHILSCTSRHPFVVNLKFAYRTETTLNLVMDFCPGGELFYHLSKNGPFDEPRAKFVAAELTLALGHLHASGVAYRDLKPENILIDRDGHVRLADFGLSKEGILNVASGAHTFCGTPEYLAPEILLRRGHGIAVDWWSLGALTFEMLDGLPPFYSTDKKEMYEGILRGKLEFRPTISSKARDLIQLLLERDPTKRLGSRGGALEVQAHPFFADIDWHALLEKRYVAPWIPPTSIEECFDQTYTKQSTQHSVNAQSASMLMQVLPDFAGFSWNAPVDDLGVSLVASPTQMAGSVMTRGGDEDDVGLVAVRDRVASVDPSPSGTPPASRGLPEAAFRPPSQGAAAEQQQQQQDDEEGLFQMDLEPSPPPLTGTSVASSSAGYPALTPMRMATTAHHLPYTGL